MGLNEDLQKRAQEEVLRKTAEKNKFDVKAVMGTAEGRRYIARFLRTFGLRAEIFNDNGSRMAYMAGRRSAAVAVYQDILSADCYDLYQKMEMEDIELQQFEEQQKNNLVAQYVKKG